MSSMGSRVRFLPGGRSIVYAVHDVQPPRPEEWKRYLAHCREGLTEIPDYRGGAGLTVTDGGAPDAPQRQRLVQVIRLATRGRLEHVRGSIVSDNVRVRSVVAALSWHLADIRIFEPESFEAAMDFIRLTEADRETVRRDLAELAAEVPGARTVRAVLQLPDE